MGNNDKLPPPRNIFTAPSVTSADSQSTGVPEVPSNNDGAPIVRIAVSRGESPVIVDPELMAIPAVDPERLDQVARVIAYGAALITATATALTIRKLRHGR